MEVETLKKVQAVVAHFEVEMYKTQHHETTFGS